MKLVIIGFLYFAIMYLYRKKISPYVCFFIIFIVMAFQSNVPGDFYRYAQDFAVYNRTANNFDDVESGWYCLNRLFSFSNFSIFYFFIAIFEYWILSKFTKIYVPKKYWILPAILFFFDMNMMFFQMKGLRQALAIELGILALFTLGKGVSIKNAVLSLALSLLACSMHHTAFFVIAYIVIYILISKSKVLCSEIRFGSYLLPIVAVSLFYFIYTSKFILIDEWQPILMQLNLDGMEGYFGEMEAIEYNFLIDLIKSYFVFYVAYNLKYSYGIQRYITLLCLLGLYMDMFLFGMGNLFRTTLYLTIFCLFVYPNVAFSLKQNHKKVESVFFIILSIGYVYRTFVTVSMRGMPDALDNYRFMFEF